jgi:hypothetical protein
MFNEENEQDEQTKKLLDAICENVIVPSEDEEQETLDWQEG